MIKKTIALIVTLLLSFSILGVNTVDAGSNDGYFIVTAYYSPLPNQSKYIMGSYAAEVRMNGQGYRGAGGKKVFSGMLAAPSIYGFGTKIYLEGLGVGTVEDRGGAIVKAGERNFSHDRIDIWVGHGEEGLQRAMYWGNRKIKGNVVASSTPGSLNIKKMYAPKWATSYLPTNQTYLATNNSTVKKNTEYPFFNYGIGTKTNKESVVLLQKFLKKINLYNGTVSGVYNTQLMNNIYAFQKENNIVKNWSDINAGYWSAQTRSALWKKYTAGEFTKKETEVKVTQGTIEEKKVVLQSTKAEETLENIIAVEKTEKLIPTNKTELIDIFTKAISNTQGVERLQRILAKLGFYEGEITGDYDDVKAGVLSFQLVNKVIESKTSVGAGNYGPATRKKLDEVYKQYGEDKKTDTTIESIIFDLEDEQEDIIEIDVVKETSQARTRIANLGNIKPGDISHGVRDLQKILNELGFFDQKDTAIFGPKTQEALTNYQLQKKVISDTSIYGAGLLGPKTKAQLIKDLSEI